MVASQNGWRANDRSVISTKTVPGTGVKLAVRTGPAGDLLIAAAARWNREVEPLEAGTCWGYAERVVRGGTDLSNHASGTAIDLNAPQHPLSTQPSANFSGAELAAVRRIIGATGGVLRWGGDYNGRKDGMHVEVNDGQSEASCARALAAIGGASPSPGIPAPAGTGSLRVGSVGADVVALQQRLRAAYRSYAGNLATDGKFGPATEAAVKEFQRRSGLTADGIVGAKTRAALRL